jgi:hypothetical protein
MLDLPEPIIEDRLNACAVGRGQGEVGSGACRAGHRRIGTRDVSLSEIGFGCGGNAGLMVRGSAAKQERAVGRFSSLEQMEEIVAGVGAPPSGVDQLVRPVAPWTDKLYV